jgi:hypothetical protein
MLSPSGNPREIRVKRTSFLSKVTRGCVGALTIRGLNFCRVTLAQTAIVAGDEDAALSCAQAQYRWTRARLTEVVAQIPQEFLAAGA